MDTPANPVVSADNASSAPEVLPPGGQLSPKPKKVWLIILIIVIAAIAVGAILYITVGKKWLGNQNIVPVANNESNPAISEKTDTKVQMPVGWKSYENERFDYSFAYPADWKEKFLYIGDSENQDRKKEYATGAEVYKIENDAHTWKFMVRAIESRTGYSSSQQAFAALHDPKANKTTKIYEEGPIMLDGREAYYGAFEHQTAQVTSDTGVILEPKIVWEKTIVCQQGKITYELRWTERLSGESKNKHMEFDAGDNYIPFDQYDEVFPKIVETFRFQLGEIAPTPEVLNTGCLQFPVKKGNSWKYRVTGKEMGLETNYEDTSTITEMTEQDFNLHTDRTSDIFTAAIDWRYGFDNDRKNMYLNMRQADVRTDHETTLAAGIFSYYGFKVFSCDQDQWPLEVKTVFGNIASDQLGGDLGGAAASIIGSAKVIDRQMEVNVPAGTFTAVLVEQEYEQKVDMTLLDSSISIPVKDRFWYSPGVGIVKEEYTLEKYDTKLTTELLEYKI